MNTMEQTVKLKANAPTDLTLFRIQKLVKSRNNLEVDLAIVNLAEVLIQVIDRYSILYEKYKKSQHSQSDQEDWRKLEEAFASYIQILSEAICKLAGKNL